VSLLFRFSVDLLAVPSSIDSLQSTILLDFLLLADHFVLVIPVYLQFISVLLSDVS
jgi:hypothetical protein